MNDGAPPLAPSGDKNLQQVTGDDQKEKKKGALARIKDSIKAVPTKIKSGMKTLASKITSPFKRKKGPDTTTDSNKLEGGSSTTHKGLFSRTKTRVADMGRAIAKALSPTKNKSANEETLEMKEKIMESSDTSKMNLENLSVGTEDGDSKTTTTSGNLIKGEAKIAAGIIMRKKLNEAKEWKQHGVGHRQTVTHEGRIVWGKDNQLYIVEDENDKNENN